MRKHWSILGIPVESGAGQGGSLMGPDALRTAGLPRIIAELGYDVVDLGNLAAPDDIPDISGPKHLEKLSATVAWTKAIHVAAYDLAKADTHPLFVGGDHSMAAGTLTGLALAAADADRPLFVLWLDAHPDMNTLETTLSGHLHGTPMAYAMGRDGFEGIFPPVTHPIQPDHVCMMGLRSIDPPEKALIAELGMDVLAFDDVTVAWVATEYQALDGLQVSTLTDLAHGVSIDDASGPRPTNIARRMGLGP